MATVTESVARPVRTVAHGSAAWVVTEGIDAFFFDMNDRQYGVLIVGLAMIFSYVQVIVENRLGGAVLREMPPVDPPVVDHGGV